MAENINNVQDLIISRRRDAEIALFDIYSLTRRVNSEDSAQHRLLYNVRTKCLEALTKLSEF